MADQQPDARRRGKAPKAAAAAAAAPADGNGQQQAPRGGRRPRLNEDEAEKVIIDTDVFVKQLPAEFQKEDLQNKFAAFGEIKQFRLRVRQRRPMLSVSYADAASAKKAIDALNGSVYNGSTLSVEIRRSIKRPDEPQQQQQQSQQQSQQPQQKKRERKPRNNNNNNNNNNAAAAAAAAAPAEEQRAAPNPNNVWVGGISNTVTEADLRGFFGSGDYTVAVRGRFAILSFPDPSGAKKALDKNGQKLGEYEIKVEAEKGRKIRNNNNNNNNNGGNNNNNGSSGSSGKSSGRPRRRRPRPANPKRLYFRNFVREVNDADVKAKFPGIQRILHLGKLGMVIFDTEENANAALALKEAEFSGVKITIEKGREAPKDGAAAPSQ